MQLTLRKARNYLYFIDMAKNKTVLQTLGFAFRESEVSFASQCIFTTLPLGRRLWSLWVGSQWNRSVEILSLLS